MVINLQRGIRPLSLDPCYDVSGISTDRKGVISQTYTLIPSGRTMARGLTRSLTEMSTSNIFWGVEAASA